MSVQLIETAVGCPTQEALLYLQESFKHHAQTAARPLDYCKSGSPIFTHVDPQERQFFAGDNARISYLNVFNAIRLRVSSVPEHMITAESRSPIKLELGYAYTPTGVLQPLELSARGALTVTMAAAGAKFRQIYQPKMWPDGGHSLEPQQLQDGSESLDQASIMNLSAVMLRIADAQLTEVGSRS